MRLEGDLATSDPHVQTKHYKIPRCGVNRPNIERDTATLTMWINKC